MISLSHLASGVSVDDLSAAVAILAVVVGAVGGFVTYLLRRRGTTGTTDTSDAAVLWTQAQTMRAELQGQVDKVTEQRDRLIESQSSQVLPVLNLIIESLQQITGSLARLEGKANDRK